MFSLRQETPMVRLYVHLEGAIPNKLHDSAIHYQCVKCKQIRLHIIDTHTHIPALVRTYVGVLISGLKVQKRNENISNLMGHFRDIN